MRDLNPFRRPDALLVVVGVAVPRRRRAVSLVDSVPEHVCRAAVPCSVNRPLANPSRHDRPGAHLQGHGVHPKYVLAWPLCHVRVRPNSPVINCRVRPLWYVRVRSLFADGADVPFFPLVVVPEVGL